MELHGIASALTSDAQTSKTAEKNHPTNGRCTNVENSQQCSGPSETWPTIGGLDDKTREI
jgi:hypothetical protein